MNQLKMLIQKAGTSTFRLWMLNKLLHRVVPFNKPHGLRLMGIAPDELKVALKYKRNNWNHIKGIHACALATLCEYTSGLMLLYHLDPDQYRIILKSINIHYHYQAKMEVTATCSISQEQVEQEILHPLQSETALLKIYRIEVIDKAGNSICTGNIEWQIKAWNKVTSVL